MKDNSVTTLALNGVIQVSDLNIPSNFIKKNQPQRFENVCSICSNCCYTDCTGGA